MNTKEVTRAAQSAEQRGKALFTQAYRLSQLALMLTVFTFVVGTPISSAWSAVASVIGGLSTIVVVIVGWVKMRRGAKLLNKPIPIGQRLIWALVAIFSALIVISSLPYLLFWNETVQWMQCRATALTLQGQQRCYADFVPRIVQQLTGK
ncbi:MAG: hypothetical protein Q4Q03_07005 [Bowdeniella nasicola]|nr:hypothetical protein [Bowdeniella nasicola]